VQFPNARNSSTPAQEISTKPNSTHISSQTQPRQKPRCQTFIDNKSYVSLLPWRKKDYQWTNLHYQSTSLNTGTLPLISKQMRFFSLSIF